MVTVTDRLVEAYRQSVRETPPALFVAADLETDRFAFVQRLQDQIDVGITLARHLARRVTAERTAGEVSRERAAFIIEKLRELLRLMAEVEQFCGAPFVDDAELRDRDEFDDAVVDLRLLMADLQGVAAGFVPPPAPSDAERDRMHEEFSRLAQVHRPPQSWFEEDHTKLVGPG